MNISAHTGNIQCANIGGIETRLSTIPNIHETAPKEISMKSHNT